MRIAILSDPNNFHTQKWAQALRKAGAEIVVISYDPVPPLDLHAVQLRPPIGNGKGGYTYLDYLRGGPVLRAALEDHRIQLLNPLNITPFGVWAMQSGFHPTLMCAFGADVLEYPPNGTSSPMDLGRSWDALDTQPSLGSRLRNRWKQKLFRRKVGQALAFADGVTGDNQYLVDCMQAWFQVPPAKAQVLRWGVEPELFEVGEEALAALRTEFGIDQGQKVILSPRGAKPIYQADILIAAFEKILAGGRTDTTILMLGAGYALSKEVSIRAEKLAKSYPNFRFIPQAMPREKMAALWNLVDVFVSAPVYDGYSAALAEGRYAGAIPVVNDIPANRELIVHDQNGWICHPFEAGRLASDLVHILDHLQSYHDRFAPENRAWVLQHSLLDDNARKFLDIASRHIR